MKAILMKCGHTAHGQDSKGAPVCAMCMGYDPRAKQLEKDIPDLNNRAAVCSCGRKVPSRIDLPLFEYRRYSDIDRYYCGHKNT